MRKARRLKNEEGARNQKREEEKMAQGKELKK